MAQITLPGDNPVPPIAPPSIPPFGGSGGGQVDLSGIGNFLGNAWMTLTDPATRDRAIAEAKARQLSDFGPIDVANALFEATGVPQAQRVGAGLISPVDAMPPIFPGQGLISAAGTAERGTARTVNAIPAALEGAIGEAAPGAGAFASREARPIVAGRTNASGISAAALQPVTPESAAINKALIRAGNKGKITLVDGTQDAPTILGSHVGPDGNILVNSGNFLTPGVIREIQDETGKVLWSRSAPTSAASGQVASRTVQQQIDALRAKGLSPEEARATFQVAPEPTGVQTATTAQLDPGKMTRALQTALGHAEGGGMPPILADYSTTGPFAPKDLTKHGGVIGAATRAVMAGDKDVMDILGPDLTQQLAQGKIAQLARNAGATEDAIRSAFGIMDQAAAAVAPDVKAIIRQAVRTGAKLDPEAEQTLFAAEHKAISQVGLPVTNDAVGALTDRLVAEARRVNKAVAGQTATLDQATQEGNSLFKAAGNDIVPAAPADVMSGGGAPPAPPTVAPPSSMPPAGGNNIVVNALRVLNDVAKSARATLDVSQLGRQGAIPIISAAISRNPEGRVIARDAFVNAVRGYGDRYAGQAWERVTKDPLYQVWRKAGAVQTEIPAESLAYLNKGLARDAQFTNALDRVPVVGVATQAANRSFALTLNALSFYRWKQGYQAIKANKGIVTEAEQNALARWEDVISGRRKFLPGTDSKVLNGIFWAPNLAISRVATPFVAAQMLADPVTRAVGIRATQDLAKSVAAGLTMLAVADRAGLKVDWNPTSSTFATVRVGNTTIDPWAGFRQPFVLVARLVTDQITNRAGQTTALSQAKFGQPDVPELIWRYVQGKFSPLLSTAMALKAGKDFVGQPFGPLGGHDLGQTVGDITGGSAIPMSPQQAAQAVIDDLTKGTSVEHGLPPGSIGAVEGLLNIGGVGVQTYDRPTMRDGLGREIGGDKAEPGPTPVTQAWDAMRARSEEKAKASGGTPDFPKLDPPDKNVGGGLNRITLDSAEADRLAVLVGQERDKALTQLVTSSLFPRLGPTQQEKQLLTVKGEADRAGQETFALEAVKSATDPVAQLRAIRVGLVAASSTPERMDFISQLSKSGALTHEMEGAIDDLRTQSDPAKANYQPSVNELLTWSGNAQNYVAAPAWRVGDPATWAAVAAQATRLRAVHADLAREASSRGLRIEQLPDYKQYVQDFAATTAGAYKIGAFITLAGDVNKAALSPQRLQIQSLPLWSHFRTAVEARDPYAIR